MTTIEELIKKQIEFDKQHSSNFNWDVKINDDNIEMLEYLLIAMVGEFGELANLIKKIRRGDQTIAGLKHEISEEIVDIFIYAIKLIYQLDIDFEKVYSEKMTKNLARFKKYSK